MSQLSHLYLQIYLTQASMVQGHILKFLDRQQPRVRISKQFCPEETFGHSKEFPDQFKRNFSLQTRGGYQYKYDGPQFQQKFKYQSQKNDFKINNPQNKIPDQKIAGKRPIHNLKKGLLSEYLDRNAWMKQTVPLNGFQRNQESRRLNNQDRKQKISRTRMQKSVYIASKTTSNFYSTKRSLINSDRQIKTSHQNFDLIANQTHNLLSNTHNLSRKLGTANSHQRSQSITLLMAYKLKIRLQRNNTAANKIHPIQKMNLQETLINQKLRSVDSQFVQQRAIQTARQWGIGRKSSPQKSIKTFNNIIEQNQNFNTEIKNLNRGTPSKKPTHPIKQQLQDNFSFECNKFPFNKLMNKKSNLSSFIKEVA